MINGNFKSKLKNISSIKFFGNFFILSSLFPFLGNPNFDSQLFALFFSLIFIFSCLLYSGKIRFTRNILWYGIWAFSGCIISFALDPNLSFLTVRAILGYGAILTYYCAFYMYLSLFNFPSRLIVFSISIWIFIGVAQIFYPNLTTGFVALRTTPERGVTSLSPEPTYFAIFLYFSCWLILVYDDYQINFKNLVITLFCLSGCIFLAKSSMVLFFILISIIVLMFYFSIKNTIISLYIFLIFLIVIFCVSFLQFENDRLSIFITSLREIGLTFFLEDASANQRLSSIIIPAISLLSNNLIPSGFNQYAIEGSKIAEELWPLFPYPIGDKIMSWNLAMWYELGIFGLFAWFSLFNLTKWNLRETLEIFLLALLLFSAVPHLFPLPAMLLALIRYKNSLTENRINLL